MDACLQLMMVLALVNPAKDVRIGCPDTPSYGFVNHYFDDQFAIFPERRNVGCDKLSEVTQHDLRFTANDPDNVESWCGGMLRGVATWASGRFPTRVSTKRCKICYNAMSYANTVNGKESIGKMEWGNRVMSIAARAANNNTVINVLLVGSFAALTVRSVNQQRNIEALEAEKESLVKTNKALKKTVWDWKQQLFGEPQPVPLARLKAIYGEAPPLQTG
ncbi:hypothetical protein CK203_012527 [Vitis vinifera]|uniref:Uncharacterized protein n=3 Tax=Vitis vinifera TaxID=29760 RepID=A0A438KMY8_VITVI|nr:hypothetical protein CK203_012527 [Vitis vinifera]